MRLNYYRKKLIRIRLSRGYIKVSNSGLSTLQTLTNHDFISIAAGALPTHECNSVVTVFDRARVVQDFLLMF